MTQNYKEIAVFPSLSCHKAELTPKKAGLLGPLINNSRSRYQSQPYPSLLCTVPTDMTSSYLCQNKKVSLRGKSTKSIEDLKLYHVSNLPWGALGLRFMPQIRFFNISLSSWWRITERKAWRRVKQIENFPSVWLISFNLHGARVKFPDALMNFISSVFIDLIRRLQFSTNLIFRFFVSGSESEAADGQISWTASTKGPAFNSTIKQLILFCPQSCFYYPPCFSKFDSIFFHIVNLTPQIFNFGLSAKA